MLDLVAPLGLAMMIRTLTLSLPQGLRAAGFTVIFSIYLILLAKLLAALFCRLDYLAATHVRQSGRSPLSVQHWLGDFMERLPRYVRTVSMMFVLITCAWTIVTLGIKPAPYEPLGLVAQQWTNVLISLGTPAI